jgi:hypothetical protein
MMTKTHKEMTTKGGVRTSVGRSTLRGADAHREVGPGTVTMMGTTMETDLMTVTNVSSEE